MLGASVVLALASCCVILGEDRSDYPRREMLMEPRELHAAERGVLILDARPKAAYMSGHIPGAIWVDEDEWKKEFQEGSDVAAWEKRIGALGIDGERPVVIYDDSAGNRAARVWWILRYFGVADVRLLNGFWRGWNTEKLPVESDPNPPATTEFRAKTQAKRLVRKDELLQGFQGDEAPFDIVDARSHAEYCGNVPFLSKRPGHMPGAKHLDWADLIDTKGTHRFRSAQEMQKLFHAKGIDPTRPIVTHCQSGGRSSVMAFALELMGADQVANYYASWAEWGNAEDTPIERTPEENSQDNVEP